jgi:hypothetical protein
VYNKSKSKKKNPHLDARGGGRLSLWVTTRSHLDAGGGGEVAVVRDETAPPSQLDARGGGGWSWPW